MRSLLLALLVLAPLAAPAAHASLYVCAPPLPGVFACGGEANGAAGSCDTAGYAYGYDTLFVFTPAAILVVYAGSSCYASPTLAQEATVLSAAAYTPVVATEASWAHVRQADAGGTTEFCEVFLTVGTSLGWHDASAPCVAPPPNPGWGHLLP